MLVLQPGLLPVTPLNQSPLPEPIGINQFVTMFLSPQTKPDTRHICACPISQETFNVLIDAQLPGEM